MATESIHNTDLADTHFAVSEPLIEDEVVPFADRGNMTSTNSEVSSTKLDLEKVEKVKKLPPQITKTYRNQDSDPSQPPLLNLASLST